MPVSTRHSTRRSTHHASRRPAGDGRSARWEGQRAARREEFVRAAVRVVDRDGPDASIAAIGRGAGVTKPVLYRHFVDKDDLLRAVGMWGAQLLIGRLDDVLSADLALVELVRSGADTYFTTVAEHPGVFRLVVSHRLAGEGCEDPLETGKTVIAGQVARLIRVLLASTEVDPASAEPLSAAVVGMALGLTEWWLAHPDVTREAIAAQLSALLIVSVEGLVGSSDRAGAASPLFTPLGRSAP